MVMRIEEISAVVTGAAGGIGEPLCRRLVAQGANVLLVGRSTEKLGRLADVLANLRGSGVGRHEAPRQRVDVVAVDLTTSSGRLSVRAAAEQRRANVLVHGAAVPAFGEIQSMSDDTLTTLFLTDIVAPIALTRELLPQLQRAPRASVLAIGSMVGEIGLPGFTSYGAAKAGLRTFCEALRRELAETSVRVQYLAARATRTGFNDPRTKRYNELTKTRSDPPERVADAVVDMLRTGQAVRHLGMPERLFVRLNGAVPTWIDGGFATHRDALRRSASEMPTAASAAVTPTDPEGLQR